MCVYVGVSLCMCVFVGRNLSKFELQNHFTHLLLRYNHAPLMSAPSQSVCVCLCLGDLHTYTLSHASCNGRTYGTLEPIALVFSPLNQLWVVEKKHLENIHCELWLFSYVSRLDVDVFC